MNVTVPLDEPLARRSSIPSSGGVGFEREKDWYDWNAVVASLVLRFQPYSYVVVLFGAGRVDRVV
jgi:hypothetical protein